MLNEKNIDVFKKRFTKLVLKDVMEAEGPLEQYSLETDIGKAVYSSFSDEELLELLREKARILDHSPSKREVAKVFKEYIKSRFGKWPYALKQANLSRSAGSGGKTFKEMEHDAEIREQLFEKLRQYAIKNGCIPTPEDLPEISEPLKKYDKSWDRIIKAAGLDNPDEKTGM